MKKNIFICGILLTSLFITTGAGYENNDNNAVVLYPFKTEIQIELKPKEYEKASVVSSEEALKNIEICKERKEQAHLMANAARGLEYNEDHAVIEVAKKEWQNAQEDLEYYNEEYEKALFKEQQELEQKRSEYSSAVVVWEYLKGLGYSDYVCAGILGNMMAEVGGQTLDLDIDMITGGYYGICQWSKEKEYASVWGKDLMGQLNFLSDTIEKEFNTYGFCYKTGFKFKDFLNLKSPEEAALAFAECYERCNPRSNKQRQKNARYAYNYFTK